jgi:asparagine synthase (glutamine-hydrolysing)
LIDAIKLQLRSDVEVYTCLSLGRDSSSIAEIASNEFKLGANFKGIQAKSPGKYTDDSQSNQMAADALNSNIDYSVSSEDYFRTYLEAVTLIQEEPIGESAVFMQYAVSKNQNNKGVLSCKVGRRGMKPYQDMKGIFILNTGC